MSLTLAEKIIQAHLISGKMQIGEKIGLRIDQTLIQDATGTMAWLQFEALGVSRVKNELAVSYIDHNTLQCGFENADDHQFLQDMAAKYGAYFSRLGNGICHQVHLERFGQPGKTLLGSDSHTPTGGGLGMLAMGAGGLDVALAMAGEPFYLNMPKVMGVKLTGSLSPWVTAMDVILALLGRLTVKGGVDCVMEYFGEGVKKLSVPHRATITNMGAELGATGSVFPSDEITQEFLQAQGRSDVWRELSADEGCNYSQVIELNLSELEPMIARPHSPDNVCPVKNVAGTKVDQVLIGSCTNSSYELLSAVAQIVKGRTVHPLVSLSIAPGSRQVLNMLAQNNELDHLISTGARILESACGPCIGMGQSPSSAGNSLRTFNRNFPGRSGTKDANVYLVSPLVAIASALTGMITDPRDLGQPPVLPKVERFLINDNMVIPPQHEKCHSRSDVERESGFNSLQNRSPITAFGDDVQVRRGPNIQPLPLGQPLPEKLTGKVLIKVGDNISTDHILPAGAEVLPLRSNIPAISRYVFAQVDKEFSKRAQKWGGGFIVGGVNYGQGSSREHAALAPMYLGIRAVITKSFARIHQANLVNFGILPLCFADPQDYDKLSQGDDLELTWDNGASGLKLLVKNKQLEIKLTPQLSARDKELVEAGGTLAWVKGAAAGLIII
ncbi:MAG: aconitate hydratase [Candidatus Schekmanbacteria bacterium]|nr:aconitate hydratase [Candidatus Schekmanbacteria bacterium]